MQVTYIDHMGNDLTVVNAARVSFNKKSELKRICIQVGDSINFSENKVLVEKDVKLIKYLAEHNHTTPFRHCYVTLHMKVPFFVRNQLLRHTVGFSVNEVSRRYVDERPDFYTPSEWRKRAQNKKQGSGEVLQLENMTEAYQAKMTKIMDAYQTLVAFGLCPEQARMILPQSTYTEFYWTGSLQGWAELCKQRLAPDTQKETREVAQQIEKIVEPLYPVSWQALKEYL